MNLRACHRCGQIHDVPPLAVDETARCVRCWAVIVRGDRGDRSRNRTAAAAIGALALYGPAVLLPIMEVERLGRRHATSLLNGTIDMLRHGDWFVGLVVLLFSIVFPLCKLLLLLDLSVVGWLARRHRAAAYRALEHAGRWSMMDVMLLAFLVMLVKLGNLIQFRFGPAVLAFVMCVAMSMVAALCFEPQSIWDAEESAPVKGSDVV